MTHMADYHRMHALLGGDHIASRATNALVRGGIITLDQLRAANRHTLASLRGMGPASLKRTLAVRDRLREKNRTTS